MGRTGSRWAEPAALLSVLALLAALAVASSWAPAGAQDDAGAPPGDLPRTLSIEDTVFLFDRLLPIDPGGFQQVAAQDERTLYAPEAQAPFSRVYVAAPEIPDGEVARYWPIVLGDPNAACPAEGAGFGVFQLADGSTYVPAGLEPDLTPDLLQSIGDADLGSGQTVPLYADAAEQPFPELFVGTDQGLQRYLLIGDDGLTATLAGNLEVADRTFAFAENVTESVDRGTLTKVGCLGLFPAFSTGATEPPIEELFIQVGDDLLRFAATEAPPAETAPADETAPAETATGEPPIEPTDGTAVGEETPADGGILPTDPTEAAEPTQAPEATEQTPAEPTVGAAEPTAEPTVPTDGAAPAGPLDLPDGLPREVTVADARFALDRAVPLNPADLLAVGADSGLEIFAKTDAPPFDAVYGAVPPAGGAPLARYLAENLGDPSRPCAAEAVAVGNLALGEDILYAFAGYEPDLVVDNLVQVFEADGTPVYAEAAGEEFPELFLPDQTGLRRFVRLAPDLRPPGAVETLAFAGQEFAFVGDATNQFDPATLVKLGCAGPFPVFTDQAAATQPFGVVYLLVGGAYLQFDSGEAPVAVPTEPPVATETPAPPTETPAPPTETLVPPTETAIPTETPLPPTETPVPPTETLIPPTETPIPTDTPAPPTDTPIPTDTPVPPTDTPVPSTDTPVPPTAEPTVAAAEPPTETPVPEAPTETPAPAVPTETPVPPVVPTDTPAAAAPTATPVPPDQPQPPLQVEPPPTIQVAGTTFALEPGDVDIELQALAQVQIVEIEGATFTIYVEQNVQVAAARNVYLVAEDGGIARYVSTAPAPTPTPTLPPVTATPPAEAPAQIEVQNTTYVFNSVDVDVDIQTLVQIEVVVIQNVEYTVYARQPAEAGVTAVCYLVTGDQVVGSYVPQARANPAPPPELPPVIQVQGSDYVFNEVEVEIDIQVLVQVQVVVINNVELTIYVDQQVQGAPPKLYAVAPGEQVVGQYVGVVLIQQVADATPTAPVLQPPAAVPTFPPNVPPPAAATAVSPADCPGNGGAIDVAGLPERLPKRIQYRGTAYAFDASVPTDQAGNLTRLGCAGPFAVYATDQAPREEVLYLREESDAATAYRFNASRTFTVQLEVTGRARVVQTGETSYELVDSYERSVYSSVTAILFVEQADDPEPDFFYALRVDADVIGRYEPESDSLQEPAAEVAAAAQTAYLNPDLVVNGRRYVLTAVLTPQGATTNGFVTLYAVPNQETPDLFLGTDPRRLELLVYRRSGT